MGAVVSTGQLSDFKGGRNMEEIKPPQYYVEFDEAGSIYTFYVDDIHENIPESAIPITVDEWQLYLVDRSKWKLDGDTIREKTPEEIAEEEANRPPAPPREPTETEVLGQQLVDRELEALELRTQNEVLGGQIVEKELQILDLKSQNDALGASLVGMELRLLELEGGKGDVQ